MKQAIEKGRVPLETAGKRLALNWLFGRTTSPPPPQRVGVPSAVWKALHDRGGGLGIEKNPETLGTVCFEQLQKQNEVVRVKIRFQKDRKQKHKSK